MTIIRSTTACVSLLALAGCVAVPPPGPSYAPAYAPAYSAPAPVYSTAPVYAVPAPAPTVIYTQPAYVAPPRYRNGPPPRNPHQDRPRQDNQRPGNNYSRSLGGSQTNPNVGQP